MQLQDVITIGLTVLAVMLAASTVAFFSYGFYTNVLDRFLVEVAEESAGVSGARNVLIRRLGSASRRFMWPGYEARRLRDLVKAGEPYGYKAEDIFALQEIGGFVGLLFGLVLGAAMNMTLMAGLIAAIIGTFYPLIWLRDQVKRRHLQISRALPFNLDLLTLSVEAGLDFTAALAKVVEKGKTGALRDELQLVLKQLKMGKTREEALKTMIARVDLPPLSQFVASLIQADRMGTNIGKVLRIQSTQLRIDRTQRAEKLANEAPVKMLFPLIACIFPTVFMVLFGPIVFAFR